MAASTEILSTRSAPHRNVVKSTNPLTSPDSVRVYRASPEDVMLQLRRKLDYTSVSLSFDEARALAAMLLAAVPELVTDASGLIDTNTTTGEMRA